MRQFITLPGFSSSEARDPASDFEELLPSLAHFADAAERHHTWVWPSIRIGGDVGPRSTICAAARRGRSRWPSLDGNRVLTLTQLRFIDRDEAVHFLGQPCSGKTHLAIALGVEVVKAGRSVYFCTLPELDHFAGQGRAKAACASACVSDVRRLCSNGKCRGRQFQVVVIVELYQPS